MWEPGSLNDHEDQSFINGLGGSSRVFLVKENLRIVQAIAFWGLFVMAAQCSPKSYGETERCAPSTNLIASAILSQASAKFKTTRCQRPPGLLMKSQKHWMWKIIKVQSINHLVNQKNMSENCLFSAWEQEGCISGKEAGKEAPFLSTFDVLGAGVGIYGRNPKFMLVRVQPQDCCYFTMQMKKLWFQRDKVAWPVGSVESNEWAGPGGIKERGLSLSERCLSPFADSLLEVGAWGSLDVYEGWWAELPKL